MSKNNWKVLIIEDEEGIRRVLSIALSDTGYEVLTAADGESGIRVCQEESPHIIVTDIRMPGMDGIDVLKRVKELDPDREVIVVTGFGEVEVAIRALQLKASDFITKPINHDALLVALDRAKGRYMARKELRDSEAKYSSLVENSLTGIYMDQDGKIEFANKRFAEIYGYSKDELIGLESWKLVHPEYRAITDEIRAKRLRGEEAPSQYEAKGLTRNGETIWIVRRNTQIEYRGRRAILGNIEDVTELKLAQEALRRARDELEQRVKDRTSELSVANKQLRREIEERKRAEQELRKSEEKYRLLFNYDPNPLFVVDMDSCKILDVNDPATVTYEYKRKEMLGMPFEELFDPGEADRLWGGLRPFAEKEYIFLPKLWARKKDGHCFFINLHARAGKLKELENGDVSGTVIVRTVDVAQRLEQEAQLIQASKMATLGEMATGIAHELNQPLNVMRVGTDFLAKMIKRGEKISEEQLFGVSRNISAQVDRATYIINHLREFGRKSEFEVYPVDLNEPIRDVFTLLGQQLRLKNVEVGLKLEEGLPKILADKNRLEQIFLNLVTNARDAMEAKGPEATKELTITSYQEGDRVVAVVSDTGSGLSEEIRNKIFEPFFTTKEVGKGTGLGLSITYNLVKGFKGDIHTKSTLNVGTTFRLTFPICQEEGDPRGEVTRH
jgi:PAS domain S-box-containing protein